jgi:hypothetical protein
MSVRRPVLGAFAILHAPHRADPKRFQSRVIQFAGIVLLHGARESWLIRHVEQNLTLSIDRLIRARLATTRKKQPP